ncbi:MAG: tRNA (adenosine(37)-N6)-dimethylallyltransferase MiaA [Clostridia bacterium]|nr:tRNA (adenosine(37)-N6)-dimethylallyltransferase MiaA [Clostridia bacterium]
MKKLVILSGPTAVGKTAISIELAKRMNAEIISADSMQVYQKMNIGTAKITPDEMCGIRHYMIDELMPDEPFNVVVFQKMAKAYMNEIYQKDKIPLLVGGTGFYIQSIIKDIDFEETNEDLQYRQSLENRAKIDGAQVLFDELKRIDPVSAEKIHANNIKRVIRALEYYHLTGKRISEHNEEESKKDSPYEYYYFTLTDQRDKLYRQIDRRVDQMMEQGLLEEVKSLYEAGYTKDLISMQGLGYKELYACLDGLCTLDEAVDKIKRETRHFAKRQLTWFKREQNVIWIDKQEFKYDDESIIAYMLQKIAEGNED